MPDQSQRRSDLRSTVGGVVFDGVLNGLQVLAQCLKPIRAEEVPDPVFQFGRELLGNGDDVAATVGRQHELGPQVRGVRHPFQ